MRRFLQNISYWVYYTALPNYIPRSRRYSGKIHLAMWCGIDCRFSSHLWKVLKGIRITLRKNHEPILVIKKGEV
jgi:hypothetical protein